jgi:hypothetical protein
VSLSGGASSGGGISRAAGGFEREDGDVERRGEAAAALWVSLAARMQVAPERLPLGEIEPPSAWRGSAGDLTPPTAQSAGPAGEGTAAEASDRLTLHVDGGDLGDVSLTLEREGGALRVVIGLENERHLGSIGPDARALRGALEGAGLSVHSLNIVPASQVGTVLAQRRSNLSGQNRAADPEGSEQHEPQNQKRNQKRLQLIG